MSGPVITGRPVAPGRQRRTLPPARYRHPGDVIRLIIAGPLLAVAVVVTSATYAGAGATTVSALRLSTAGGRTLAGLMAAAFAVAAIAAPRYRRFRLLASLAGSQVPDTARRAGLR